MGKISEKYKFLKNKDKKKIYIYLKVEYFIYFK